MARSSRSVESDEDIDDIYGDDADYVRWYIGARGWRSFVRPGEDNRHYVQPRGDSWPAPSPGHGMTFVMEGALTEYQISQLPKPLAWVQTENRVGRTVLDRDPKTGERAWLVSKLPPAEAPTEPPPRRAEAPTEPPPKLPRTVKYEPPPKRARVRTMTSAATGRPEKIVQVSPDVAVIVDVDGKVGRTPKGAIGRIQTDRGAQFIFPATDEGRKDAAAALASLSGDDKHRAASEDRGSYDVRATSKTKKARGADAKVSYYAPRTIEPRGAASRGGAAALKVLRWIARAFVAAGGKSKVK